MSVAIHDSKALPKKDIDEQGLARGEDGAKIIFGVLLETPPRSFEGYRQRTSLKTTPGVDRKGEDRAGGTQRRRRMEPPRV